MKNLKLGFSLTGCALLVATFIGINILTSPQFPWSLFPVFGVLWLPLSVYSYTKKSPMMMAVTGSALIIVFFIAVNMITSPAFPWCIFPIFAVLWWPLGIYIGRRKNSLLLSVSGSFLTVLFFITVNMITSPGFPWSFFPVFVLLWWPLSVYCVKQKNMKLLSIIGSLLVISFFFVTDYITTPAIGWAFYAAFPVLLWPALLVLKKYIKIETILLASGIIFAGYYILLNLFVSPSYPWSIFVAYGILIAMISSSFWYRNQGKWATLSSVIISAAFVAAVLFIAGIKEIWVLELALIAVSTQACVHFSLKKNYRALSILGSFTVLLFVAFENFIDNPGYPWFLYVVFPVVWPLVMSMFPKQVKTFRFALFSAATGIVYYGILNLLLAPGHIWFIYPAFALIWWPLAMYYAKTRKPVLFAIGGTLLIIAFLGAVNLITSPGVVWSVFPVFAILWWPLSMIFISKKRKVIVDENHERMH